jgi:hypothetical protein
MRKKPVEKRLVSAPMFAAAEGLTTALLVPLHNAKLANDASI